MHSRLEYDSSVSQKSRQTSPFNRLYNHAASKELILENNRNQVFLKEMEECTFRPKVTSELDRSGNVFERLHQSGIYQKESPLIKYNKYKEIQECTFSPKINPPRHTSAERPFNKLYNDAEIQRKKITEKELKQKQSEIVDCTFRPNINGTTGQVPVSNSNVYEKLYNNFQEIQKQRVHKQGPGREVAEVQFVPKLMSQGENLGKYSRLYAELEKKKEKPKERERSNSAPRRKKSDEIPRFEHLYALHKDKQDRNQVLQDRFLKESGVVFKPNLNKTVTSKPKAREFSPKLAYPLPKNPNNDSSLSSYN